MGAVYRVPSTLWFGDSFFLKMPWAIAHGRPMINIQVPISTAGMIPIHHLGVKGYRGYATTPARMRDMRGTVE